MRDAVVVADVHTPADVHGVHAAKGHSRWTCLARRTGLYGGWEAVEWAWLPPGGVSGEHLHSRTEELYFLLSGRGEITLDGRPHAVRAGDTVLTGLGTRHGLRNTGRRPLAWLVVELTATPAPKEQPVNGHRSTVVRDLRGHGPLDASTVLTGPLRTVRLTQLPPGGGTAIDAHGEEHTVFVTGGTGTARATGSHVSVARGTSLTLPLGTSAWLNAGPEGIEFFHAALDVPEDQS
ncbi:cupin domain-containing protein [Streptomyces ficellus]|uniref:Cupin domain-containing protein n=1 Tax=Streptomyces ficellus TaxID=1977088 RepID=A0A6I6FFU8_9ACTN|nr:cupin domain-containing protein [Streptomyces ficellus]QGV82134.1 cupin domain-containing protein [Streptomyces ficellus]